MKVTAQLHVYFFFHASDKKQTILFGWTNKSKVNCLYSNVISIFPNQNFSNPLSDTAKILH